MREGHLEHAAEVLRRLLEPREDAAAFFKPPDQLFDDATSSIRGFVEVYEPSITIVFGLAGNDGLDVQVQQVLVDPVGSITFVSRKRHRPGHGLAPLVHDRLVRPFQQRCKGRRFVILPRSQMKVQRMPMPIAQQVNFRGKTALGAA